MTFVTVVMLGLGMVLIASAIDNTSLTAMIFNALQGKPLFTAAAQQSQPANNGSGSAGSF